MHFQTAVKHFQLGELEQAERVCRQLLAGEPELRDALHLLGMIANRAGRQQEATQLLRRAAAL